MTWTSPATPTAGTAITVSFWNTNGRDNLNHLRAMLPDATNGAILQGTGSATAAWTSSPTLASLATSGALTVGTTLGVTGATTLSSTLGVTGATTFTGATAHNGGITATTVAASSTISGAGITSSGSFTSAVSGSGGYRFSGTGEYVWNSGSGSLDMVANGNRQGYWWGSSNPGGVFVDGNVSYLTVTNRSDASLKTDIRDDSDPVTARMRGLRPKVYRLKQDDGHEHHGFVAQDVAVHFPELIRRDVVPVMDTDDDGQLVASGATEELLGFDVMGLIARLYQYVLEADKRIQTLEAA